MGGEAAQGGRQGRNHHRQAAPRPHRHGSDGLPGRIHPLLRPDRGQPSAGAVRIAVSRDHAQIEATGPDFHLAGGVLTVDLEALADNWRTMARLSEPAEAAAAVKADAYGLGAAEV